MNVCRAFWTGLVSLLLPIFSASPSSAAPVPELPKSGVLRHFHYWSEYGEEAARPGGLERIRFELQRNRIYFSQGRPLPDTFSVQTDGSLNRELVPVLAALDLSGWPGQMEQSKLYDLPDKKKRRLCQWHIGVAFEPEKPGDSPVSFSLYGADDGASPKRLAAEQALRHFFGPKLDALKAATPRRLTGLLWLEHGVSYDFDVEDSGIATLKRRKDGARRSMNLYPAFAEELNSIIRASGIEKHHAFFQRCDDRAQEFSLGISFDTRQRIEVIGHSGAGGTPEGFFEALAPLLKAMDDVMDAPASKALPPTKLSALEFRVSGMVIGEDVRLYERMDRGGPVLVLNRTVGHSAENIREAVLDAAQLAELEALLEKNGVRGWDGFNGRPRMDVLDGEGFSFSLLLRDGTKVSANGENAFPANYRSFRRELRLFADKLLGGQE
ncbi:MAG: hypothetical protein IKL01_05680 [Mailhella sp.]|nr:hypothetical protein [Mailhella sp.]